VKLMTTTEPLRVMTFNVRQMDGDDGAQSWEHRRDLLAQTIRLYQPTLLGTQEIFPEQTDFLLERLRDYDCFGRGRFGDNRDKHNKIFFDRRRFALNDSGELWFSHTPSVPGSSAWSIPRPRMVTWGKLRQNEGTDILVLNTHFPYSPDADEARRQSARLVLEKIAALPQDLPLFLLGDFNAPAGGEIYHLLTGALSDAWETAKQTTGPEGTVHGFGKITGKGPRLRFDWILHRSAGKVLTAETITYTVDGLYPSDHYPVMATFLFEERSTDA
jgi:endonuclease/exonuclease/phosphatase family metal-dependent hydrolase